MPSFGIRTLRRIKREIGEMSSHHIIREKQEPALIIVDILDFDLENLGQLLEWSPTVIVLKAAVEKVYSLGLKMDVIIDDTEETPHLQEHTKQIKAANGNFLKAALTFLIEDGYNAVNIITSGFDTPFFTEYIDKIDIVLLNYSKRAFAVKSGFSKWKPAQEEITVLSIPDNLQTEGLTQISENTYITEKDGLYRLTFSNQHLFIAESL